MADAGNDQHLLRVDVIVAGTNGDFWRLAPDGKTQVMIEHVIDAYKNGDLWWVRPVGNMQVLRKVLEELILKNGQMVLSLYGYRTHLYIELSGSSLLVVLRETMT